jgi:hypothetical protein
MFLIVGSYVYSKMSVSMRQIVNCAQNDSVTFVNNTDYTFTYWPIENGAAYLPIVTNATSRFPSDRIQVTGEKTIKILTNGTYLTLAWNVFYYYDAAVCANTTQGLQAWNTFQGIDTNTFAGLSLASITPIALAASAIMMIIIIAFAFRD